VYLANPDGSNPRFIADGMGESWAPNGKWFLVMRPEIDRAAIQDKKSGLPEVKKWTCWIYTSKGSPVLELSNLSRPSLRLWSPTSEKILVMEYDASGLTVVNIQVTSGKIRGYELQKVLEPSAEIRNPSWSQDGRLIAFVKSYLNKSGDNYAKNEIWISTTDGKRQQKIRESIGSNTELPLWPQQGRILLLTKSVEPDRVSSVLEFTLRNIDQLLK
jgi:Tol biopolymer transport system component